LKDIWLECFNIKMNGEGMATEYEKLYERNTGEWRERDTVTDVYITTEDISHFTLLIVVPLCHRLENSIWTAGQEQRWAGDSE
jgi:hypothetical protein